MCDIQSHSKLQEIQSEIQKGCEPIHSTVHMRMHCVRNGGTWNNPNRQGVLESEQSIRRRLQFQKPLYWSSPGFWGGNKGPDTAQVALNHTRRLCLLHKQIYHLLLSWATQSSTFVFKTGSNNVLPKVYFTLRHGFYVTCKSCGSSGTTAHAPSRSCNRLLAIVERKYPTLTTKRVAHLHYGTQDYFTSRFIMHRRNR